VIQDLLDLTLEAHVNHTVRLVHHNVRAPTHTPHCGYTAKRTEVACTIIDATADEKNSHRLKLKETKLNSKHIYHYLEVIIRCCTCSV
jgi:hypothetical protein